MLKEIIGPESRWKRKNAAEFDRDYKPQSETTVLRTNTTAWKAQQFWKKNTKAWKAQHREEALTIYQLSRRLFVSHFLQYFANEPPSAKYLAG